jgi:hypothetical protein
VGGLVVVMTAALAVLGFPHLQHTEALPLSQLLDVLKRLAEVADDRDQALWNSGAS